MESDRSPSRSTVTNRNGGNAFTEYSTVTVRDYIAIKAMQALIPMTFEAVNYARDIDDKARILSQLPGSAYEIADNMIREREKQP